ncbi:MAG: hypothetical protein Q9227_004652 [Pyrenula ochraceoflavens]
MAEAQKADKPLHELLSHSMVDLYVGPDSLTYHLHEKLLCHYSPFFARTFYSKTSQTKSYGLPEDELPPFNLLVGWLYSRAIPLPADESAIGTLLDLYLLSEKLEMEKLSTEVVEAVRRFYWDGNTYPGLRRVQYIYANTEEDNAMREMMVASVARYLVLAEQGIPKHWDKALRKNGQLAVDIIRSIQEWHLEGRSVPDVRDISQTPVKGRGFAAMTGRGLDDASGVGENDSGVGEGVDDSFATSREEE